MKVAHVITTICRGGAETQLLTLAREQVKLGYDVTIYFLKDDPELEVDFLIAGVHVNKSLSGKSFIHQLLVLRKSLYRSNSIIHAHLPKSELLTSLAKSSNKLIISRHNSESFYPNAPTLVSKVLSKWVSFRSEGCISISNAVKNYLIKNNELISSKKLWVVEYGFNPNIPEQENKPKNITANITFGTVSRLVPQKDLPTLLVGFEIYSRKNNTANLLIVGKGSERNKLSSLAQDLKIEERIDWTEKTNNVYETMSQMDVFCLTSKYEGFGLVLLEAMQSEIPIIAANNSAISEVLGGDYPYLFKTSDVYDLVDKMEKLSTYQHQKIAIDYLRQRIRNFSPYKMAKRIDAIYLECLNPIPQSK